jgi:hypothetical protein
VRHALVHAACYLTRALAIHSLTRCRAVTQWMQPRISVGGGGPASRLGHHCCMVPLVLYSTIAPGLLHVQYVFWVNCVGVDITVGMPAINSACGCDIGTLLYRMAKGAIFTTDARVQPQMAQTRHLLLPCLHSALDMSYLLHMVSTLH